MTELVDMAARREVLREFQKNLIVTAGAGTGKTSLLVGRLLAALLLQHHRPAQILALTFTENAASEMRARLVRLLRAVAGFVAGDPSQKIETSDAAVLKELKLDASAVRKAEEVLANADQLPISTFHGFCMRFLQRNSRRLGLPALITLQDPEAARARFDQDFLAWIGERSRDDLREVLDLATVEALRELAWQLLGVPSDTGIASPRRPDLARITTAIAELEKICKRALSKFRNFLAELADVCRKLAADEPPQVKDVTPYLKLEKVPAPGKPQLGEDLARSAKQKVSALVAELAPWVLREDAQVAKAVEFVQPFVARQRQQRQRQGVLSFDDLVLLVRRALMQDASLREETNRGLATLLVDEFQDTDPLQYEIVFLLAADPEVTRGEVSAPLQVQLKNNVLCIVGDVKQSIYRFRRADVAAYARAVAAILAQGGKRLLLTANFRSRPPILEFTNKVCELSLRADLPWQQGYDKVEPTRPADAKARVELVRLQLEPGAKVPVRREAEGRAIVATITRLLADGHKARDIAVLLRVAADNAWLLRPLRASGIPYALAGGRRFYERHEVVVGCALVRAIASPHDVVAVLAVLRSALSRATDDDIQAHVHATGGLDYSGPRGQGAVADALALLADLRAEVALLPLDRAIERLLLGPEMVATEASGYEGAQRLANLERLASRILADKPIDLVEAAALVEQRMKNEVEDEESPLFDEDQDVVRVLTVHASKGLEYEVVIVPDIGRKPNSGDGAPEKVRAERWQDGNAKATLAVRLGDLANTAGWLAKRAGEQHAFAETRRLFYVAATRSKQLLVLVMGDETPENAVWQSDLEVALPLTDPAWVRMPPPSEIPTLTPGSGDAMRIARALAAWEARSATFAHATAALARPSDTEPVAGAGFTAAAGRGRALGRVLHEYLATVTLRREAVDVDLLAEVLATQSPADPELALAARELAERFHASGLRKELVRATRVWREHPLVWKRPEGTLVSGVLDALILDASGAYSVLDYKTERIGGRSHAAALERHKSQLLAYATAIRTALGLSATPMGRVHFLRDDVTLELVFD